MCTQMAPWKINEQSESETKGEKLKFNSSTVECLPDVIIVSHNYGSNMQVRLLIRRFNADRCHILD